MSSFLNIFPIEGKTAVITGAAGYFGRAFSECLLSLGANVILYDKDKRVEDIAVNYKKKYQSLKIEHCQVDSYNEGAYREALEKTAQNSDSIDILVNNAFEFSKKTGFNDPSGKLESISKEQWMRSFDSGVYWHALATQVLGPKMKAQKSGSIINISSMYALVSPDPALYKGKKMFNPPSYSAVKAALMAFTRYVASFYGEDGVRCNAILAGAFPHVGIESNSKIDDQEFLQRLIDKTALGRVGETQDLLGPLLFLASDASRYVTGQGISVDGGWTIR